MRRPPIARERCAVCGGALAALPHPAAPQAMVSDGRIVQAPLAKASCLACGCVSHLEPARHVFERFAYDVDYALPEAAPAADEQRAKAYFALLARHAGEPSSVLELGCGSGRLLAEFARQWPLARLTGVDPALVTQTPPTERMRLLRGGFGAAPQETFDLVISVNVVEHLPEPHELMAAIAARMAPEGATLLIWPSAALPNLELMLFDHLFSLPATALVHLACEAGLAPSAYDATLPGVGDFQMLVLRHASSATAINVPRLNPEEAWVARAGYLDAWRRLPEALQARRRPGRPLAMFGAGQMAALLRTYTPALWSQTEYLVMDSPADAWSLERPVHAFEPLELAAQDADIILALAPASQARVAARLEALNLRPIRFDDLIAA